MIHAQQTAQWHIIIFSWIQNTSSKQSSMLQNLNVQVKEDRFSHLWNKIPQTYQQGYMIFGLNSNHLLESPTSATQDPGLQYLQMDSLCTQAAVLTTLIVPACKNRTGSTWKVKNNCSKIITYLFFMLTLLFKCYFHTIYKIACEKENMKTIPSSHTGYKQQLLNIQVNLNANLNILVLNRKLSLYHKTYTCPVPWWMGLRRYALSSTLSGECLKLE